MSILISPRASQTTDQKRKPVKRPAGESHALEGFALTDVLIADPDGSVIVDVSDEGHRLLHNEPEPPAAKAASPQSTSAYLASRRS